MTTLFFILAIAFAAICIWLTVRIINRWERWAKWLAVAVAAMTLYPLTFGPVCWIANSNAHPTFNALAYPVYEPLIVFCQRDESVASETLRRYSGDGGTSWWNEAKNTTIERVIRRDDDFVE